MVAKQVPFNCKVEWISFQQNTIMNGFIYFFQI